MVQARFLWWGEPHALPTRLVDSLLAIAGDTLQMRLSVVEAHGGRILLEKDARVPITPASTLKVLTAVTALDRLGPDYRFETRAGFDARRVVGGVLRDTLHWVCGGNPDLKGVDLRRMVDELRRAGIDSLAGPVVLYTSRFDRKRLGPGWSWDDGSAAWCARISAATVNGNGLVRRHGSAVSYEGWPGAEVFAPNALDRDWVGQRDVFQALPTDNPATLFINVEHPDSLYGRVLLEAMAIAGLEHPGSFPLLSRARVPVSRWEGCQVRHRSAPLVSLLDSVLTYSWNLGAECIQQELAAANTGNETWLPRSTWEQGAGVMTSHLAELLGPDLGFRLMDGSGLSRQNAVPVEAFTRVMVADEERHPGRLRGLLARPGTGTLAGRFRDLPAGISLRGKTGSLRGCHLLVAYVYKDPDGRRLADWEPLPEEALVVMVALDGGLGNSANLRAKQERVIGLLARWLAES